MITMKLQGGLGNQMFQYAAGFAMAAKLGVELALDVTSYRTDPLRRFNLDLFRIDNQIVFDGARPTLIEQDLRYNPAIMETVRDGDVISGYFQSELYFEKYRNQLQRLFYPRQLITSKYIDYFQEACKQNSVALTVRRGDYIAKQDFHGVLPMSYYQSALARVVNDLPVSSIAPLNILVFSDDIEWCKKNFLYPGYWWKFTHVENDMTTPGHIGREDLDIELMRRCTYHVLANSTFSWWGAWLSGRPGVYAPKKWFSDLTTNENNDIVPRRWTLV